MASVSTNAQDRHAGHQLQPQKQTWTQAQKAVMITILGRKEGKDEEEKHGS